MQTDIETNSLRINEFRHIRRKLWISRIKDLFAFVSVCLFSVVSLGCYLSTSITDLNQTHQIAPIPFQEKITASGFVPGSAQFKTTLQRQYRVSASVGEFSSEITQSSTLRGYRLHSSVQAVILQGEGQ